MARFSRFFNILIVLILLLSLPDQTGFAQSGSTGGIIYFPLVTASDTPLAAIISPNTVVLPASTTQYLEPITDNGFLYTFSKDTLFLKQLHAGSVMAGGPCANAPDGFLRQVYNISRSRGNVIISTTQAALTDAVQQGSLRLTTTLTPTMVTSQQSLAGVTLSSLRSQTAKDPGFHFDLSNVVLSDTDGNFNTTNDQIVLPSGSIDLSPSIQVDLDVKNSQVTSAYLAAGANETAAVPVLAKIDFNTPYTFGEQIGEYQFRGIEAMIGPVPVVISVLLIVRVDMTGHASAGLSMDVTQTANFTAGASYSGAQWSPVQSFTNSFSFKDPQVTGDADAKLSAITQTYLGLYGNDGPNFGLSTYSNIKEGLQPVLNGTLSGGLAAIVNIPSGLNEVQPGLPGYSNSAQLSETNLKEWGPKHAPYVPSNPNPADGAVGQSNSLLLSWNGGDPYNDPVTYTIYFQVNKPIPTTVVSADQTGTSFQPVPLDTDTQYYWQVIAKDASGHTTSGPVWSFTVADGSSQSPTPTLEPSLTPTQTTTPTLEPSLTPTETATATLEPSLTPTPTETAAPTLEPNWVTAITAGTSHTCALTSGGGVKCWGDNGAGNLGDGTNISRSTPVDVVGLSSGVVAIAAANSIDGGGTCALISDGNVKCWGDNVYHELGDGTNTNRWTPVDVLGLSSDVTAISAGGDHACAITSGGGVKCWGDNSLGELGDGTTKQRLTAVDVSGLSSGVEAIAAIQGMTCALISGGVKCWGNYYGLTAVDMDGLPSGITALAAGFDHICALTSGGGVKCWGYNGYGELGDGTRFTSSSPVDVVGLSSGVSAIAAGTIYTCALMSDGGMQCWGDNSFGELGDGTTTPRLTPVAAVVLSSGVDAVATGFAHTCVLTGDGGVKCWGSNYDGQLGDGSTTNSLTPVDVVGLK